MQLAVKHIRSSWTTAASPVVLSEIFSADTSVAIWHRDIDFTVSSYFAKAFDALGMGIRGVFALQSLTRELSRSLPEQEGRDKVIEDIYLLADMLTCLFNCDSVGLRLAPLSTAMCPKFHVDNIPVRLVHTYLGSGTEWLPLEAQHQHLSPGATAQWAKTTGGMFYDPKHIQRMDAFDVALLKGKAWPEHEHMAATHRSCQVRESEKRVLLTLDPM